MELRQLRCFVAVAEELHFARAAAREKIAPSTLAEHIAALEKDIGGRLLRRTTRRVTLTPGGEALLPEARRCLGVADRAREVARLAVRGQAGVLRLGVPVTGSPPGLGQVLDKCGSLYPQLDVQMQLGYSAHHMAGLCDEALDAAFVYGPLPSDSELSYRRLVDVELVLAHPTESPLGESDTVDLSDLPVDLVALDASLSPALSPGAVALLCPRAYAVVAVSSLEALLVAEGGWIARATA